MGGNLQNRKHGADPTFPRLLGERLCLNYVNTIEGPHGAHTEDFLRNYADLVRWSRHVAVLDEALTTRLLREGEAHPDAARAVFDRAIDLRSALGGIFGAIAHGDALQAGGLAHVQAEYLAALVHAHLAPAERGYRWDWPEDDAALDRPLWSVARSAVELLTSGDPARIKACPEPDGCGWLFYDTSKNGSRQWCSMEGCGSRAKMRHLYARRRAAARARQGS